ncbi:unnamed protein product [Adineta ricciae]|uniref:G-protein coupled receptors family 1 profile domain-containing protein n=1 Tax=Adineta ricciae TaxID=249248 RepID=A0A813WQN3_ADIRI|nr:unnamed protein product [Adineta ricciae]CAF1120624.1 unnamed protein product [Adineta ricciae]
MDAFAHLICYLYQFIGIPLYISGNIGILLSLWIFLQRAWRKNVCVFYFLILLVTEFINIDNILLCNILVYGFDNQILNDSVFLCKLSKYVFFVFDIMSPSILVLASIDRLLISSANVDIRLYSSSRLAYFSLSISLVIWCIYYIHVPVKFNIYQMNSVIFLCIFELTGYYSDFLRCSQLIINVVLSLLMILLSIYSWQNVCEMKTVPSEQRHIVRKMHKKDFQMLRCLFAMNVVHVIGDSLIGTYTIYKASTSFEVLIAWEQNRDNFIFNLGIFLHLISNCTDFYIYLIASRSFRQELKRSLWKIVGLKAVETRHINNEQLELPNASAVSLPR